MTGQHLISQRFRSWQNAAVNAAVDSPFTAIDPLVVQNFTELCLAHHVPIWRMYELHQHNGFWYQWGEDREGVLLPFEDWESSTVDEAHWLKTVEYAPDDYISTVLQRVKNVQHSQRLSSCESKVLLMAGGLNAWLTSLSAKNRYHVKTGLKSEFEVIHHEPASLAGENVEWMLDAAGLAHDDDTVYNQAQILWCLARGAYFIELRDGEFRAAAGFIPDGDTLIFGCNIRNDKRSDIGQRLIYECVKHHCTQFKMIDPLERAYLEEDDDYEVYKSKVCNSTLVKYSVASTNHVNPGGIEAPYYRYDLGQWIERTS